MRQVQVEIPQPEPGEPVVLVELALVTGVRTTRKIVEVSIPASIAPKLAAALMDASREYIIPRR